MRNGAYICVKNQYAEVYNTKATRESGFYYCVTPESLELSTH